MSSNEKRQKQFDLNEPVSRLSIRNIQNKEARLLVSKVNELARKFNALYTFIKTSCENKEQLHEINIKSMEQQNEHSRDSN